MGRSLVTLTTDFGLDDAYVGIVKGVMLSINPEIRLVDLSHTVPPQAVATGAFVLGSAYATFPSDTIHLAVVDPGVGTGRRALLLLTPHGRFLAPDNGLLTYVLRDAGALDYLQRDQPFLAVVQVPLPRGFRAYALTNPSFWRHPLSQTFHARDLFAPVAAHLSLGVEPDRLGEPVEQVTCLFVPAVRWEGTTLHGHVLHTDGFGNLITSLPATELEGKDVVISLAGAEIRGLSRTYAEGTVLTAIIGSHGYLEIALPNGNAAQKLGVRRGAVVRARLAQRL